MFEGGEVGVGGYSLFIWCNSTRVDGKLHLLQGHVAEQVRDGLAVVSSTDGLCEDHGDVNHLGTEQRQLGRVHITKVFVLYFLYVSKRISPIAGANQTSNQK